MISLFLCLLSVLVDMNLSYQPEECPRPQRDAHSPKRINLPNGEEIAYHSSTPIRSSRRKNVSGVLFCSGFRSSMNGKKALSLERYCLTNLELGFTRFDYRGHGKHADVNNFLRYGMSEWVEDASAMLELSWRNMGGRQIVIGSSMGAWIAIHLALQYPEKIAGMVMLAAAPDFLQDIHESLSKEEKSELAKKGRIDIPSQYSEEPFPISSHLLRDAEKWKVLNTSKANKVKNLILIDSKCPVRLIHGQQDIDIPWNKTLELANAIAHDDVLVTLIKSGNHRLSALKDLEIIYRVLDELVGTIEESTIQISC